MEKRVRDCIVQKTAETLIRASTTFRADKKSVYKRAIEKETNARSKWVLETILDNAIVAEKNQSPLCDDTGIPHLFLEVGKGKAVSGEMLDAIQEGVAVGLRKLPGRPMAIMGNSMQRLDQSGGLDDDPAAVQIAPIIIRTISEETIRLHILMQGGGPAIRGKTYRVFHHHSVETVINEVVEWAGEAVKQLGCTPCTLAIGIGRSQLEATALMTEAQVYGCYDLQNDLESEITARVNESGIGPLGLGGSTSVLATFLRVGPQRASGVRIVCIRPCCCFEPRHASVEFEEA
ncbi:MAG: fumarate hydratase [Erysipelothrix sp.]|jgi:fumarate hydratase subunit alpha|nr:fumarate hydratase [Erysipelothrix sp.]